MVAPAAAGGARIDLRLIHAFVARQVFRQRLAWRLVARRLIHRCPLTLSLALDGLQVLQLRLQLFDLVIELLGLTAKLHAPQPGDLQLQMLDLGGARVQLRFQSRKTLTLIAPICWLVTDRAQYCDIFSWLGIRNLMAN